MARQRRSRSRLPLGLHRIAHVARTTGISEHALRIWERRYGNMASHRSEAGYRLYTEEDIARVRVIRELLDGGHWIGEIATLPIPKLLELRGRLAPATPATASSIASVVRERFIAAIERYDLDEAGRVATSAMAAFSTYDLVAEVTGPLLEEIGTRWRKEELMIAQEHAASAILRGQLGELLRSTRSRPSAPTVVATTPVGELHEFGALIAAIVAGSAGAHVVYLGPNTPATELASAVKRTGANVVLISVVGLEVAAVVSSLSEIRKAVPKSIEIWAGGRALESVPAGVVLLKSLADLRERVSEHER